MAKKSTQEKKEKKKKKKTEKSEKKDDKKSKSKSSKSKDVVVTNPSDIPSVSISKSNPLAPGATSIDQLSEFHVFCEGCFTAISVLYCIECDRALCESCSSNSHQLKVDSEHQRVRVNDMSLYRLYCTQHKKNRLQFYCNSCKRSICEQCKVNGSHSGLSHTVVSLSDAFCTKMSLLQSCLDGKLAAKQSHVLAQLSLIESKAEEVKSAKLEVERETRIELQGMLDRLAAAEGRKLAILQNDAALLKADVNEIEVFSGEVLSSKTRPNDKHRFLSRFDELADTSQVLASKPFKCTIDCQPNDLPRESYERLKILERYSRIDELLSAKDHMLWYLLRERSARHSITIANASNNNFMDQTTKLEMQEWMHLTDRFAYELSKFKLSCRYCGTALAANSVQTFCKSNAYDDKVLLVSDLHKKELGAPGTGIHFFERVQNSKNADNRETLNHHRESIAPRMRNDKSYPVL